jgi:hypothetical protein
VKASHGIPYKHFYLEGQEENCRNQQGKRTKWSEKQAGQELAANTISRMQHFFRPIPAQPVFQVRR